MCCHFPTKSLLILVSMKTSGTPDLNISRWTLHANSAWALCRPLEIYSRTLTSGKLPSAFPAVLFASSGPFKLRGSSVSVLGVRRCDGLLMQVTFCFEVKWKSAHNQPLIRRLGCILSLLVWHQSSNSYRHDKMHLLWVRWSSSSFS